MDKQNDLISRLENEADLCRSDGASDIAALLDEAVEALRDRNHDTSHNLCLSCGHSIDAHDRQYGCAEDGCDCETPNAAGKAHGAAQP